MVVKAVLFDLDGTLLDRAASVVRFIELQYQKNEALHSISQEMYVSSFIELDRNGYVWKDTVYQQLITRHSLDGVTWQFLLGDYVENFSRACIGFPHMRRILAGLKAEGYLLGVITNGRSPFQEKNIKALGIASLVSTILVSEAMGMSKPDWAIFQAALQRLGVEPSEAVFVGDSPRSDIEGAQKAGMKAVWKYSAYWKTCEFADATCTDLIALPEIIRRL